MQNKVNNQTVPPPLPTNHRQENNSPESNPFQNLDNYYKNEFTKIQSSNEKYKGKWNWYAFFFSWIWFLTKGAWAFVLIILISLFLTFGSNMFLVISIGWALISGFKGTYIYYYVKVKNKQFPKSLI